MATLTLNLSFFGDFLSFGYVHKDGVAEEEVYNPRLELKTNAVALDVLEFT